MSILKAILHRWNKTTRTYDTIHPETETSQITDFDTAVNGKINTHNSSGAAHSTLFNQCEKTSSLANDIVTKLAQTTAISAISALQTNSWFGQLLKLVLNASGMKYLIDTNGYICFGSLFGGLIIQWGKDKTNSDGYGNVTLPVTYPNKIASICFMEEDIPGKNLEHLSYYYLKNDHVEVFGQDASTAGIKINFMYISIGW